MSVGVDQTAGMNQILVGFLIDRFLLLVLVRILKLSNFGQRHHWEIAQCQIAVVGQSLNGEIHTESFRSAGLLIAGFQCFVRFVSCQLVEILFVELVFENLVVEFVE